MITAAINTINSYFEGYNKLYCLLERREKKTVEYSGGGSFNEIPFDNYAVGGYWRYRSRVTIAESEGTVACTKKQVMTYPLYFVAWFNRDNITETIDEFAQNTMALISGLRTPAIKTKVLGYDTEKQKEETGKTSQSWVLLRFEVDIIFTKNCPTTCVTPAVDECILNGSINDVAIGQFFADFNITVVNESNEEVGTWDEENSVWVVPDPIVCPTLCEQVAESTPEEIVECVQDAGLLRPVQDLICTPCPLGWSVVNSLSQRVLTGFINNPCDEPTLTVPIPDVSYYDCNGDLQTAPYPVTEGEPINRICDPCPTLPELLSAITAGNVIEEVWDNLNTGAQNEILNENCPAGCDDVTLSVNGAPQTFNDLTGCPLELDIDFHDQLGRDIVPTYEGGNLYTYDVRWGANKLATHTTFLLPHFITGHIYRFTGITFGYKIGANYFDVNGVATTEALAFPDNIVIDWLQAQKDAIGATSRVINTPIIQGNLAAQLAALVTLNGTGYAGYNDWTLTPARFRFAMMDIIVGTPVMNFDPFNNSDTSAPLSSIYCREENAATPTQQFFADAIGNCGVGNKTTSRGCHIYREFTNAELGIGT